MKIEKKVFVPVSVIYVVVQRFYVACSRQLRRIESKLKAPIYSNFQETIQEKIQSYGRDRNYPIIDSDHRTDFLISFEGSIGGHKGARPLASRKFFLVGSWA